MKIDANIASDMIAVIIDLTSVVFELMSKAKESVIYILLALWLVRYTPLKNRLDKPILLRTGILLITNKNCFNYKYKMA